MLSGHSLTNIEYADDLALLGSDPSQMQTVVNDLNDSAVWFVMRFTPEKCEVLLQDRVGSNPYLMLASEPIDVVNKFAHLGSCIGSGRLAGGEIISRIGKAGQLMPTSDTYGTDVTFATVVYNKKTDELYVIHKKPQFLGPCFAESEPAPVTDTPLPDRAALTNAFGSARRQRILKERERHADHRVAVSDATIITKAMHGQKRLKQEASESQNVESGTADERTRLLPPFNADASHPKDVYPFEKLIPSRILEALAAESETLATAPVSSYHTWSREGTYPRCVLDRLLQLSSLSNSNKPEKASENRMKIAQCLAYLSHMLALFRLPGYDIQRKQPLPDTPSAVTKHLLDEFTALVNRGESGRLKIRLKRYFVYMGCHVNKEDMKLGTDVTTRQRASLKTPVKFPLPSLNKIRKQTILG
ncbi:hypothetical protein T265_03178 [Opisthorchis viverrini]|uniref:Reverse transcriptase domain-containing protein n=1 Tax=Opisthorchis viverrini TaxID=6198 RepID=A0A074ZSP7_OPIVI|nr:hypothetical protein T265_03178 [Opisthorchis viverrini]KER30448.1 hypothetical protein T265_03178 [Opisthorchis viverrini]